MKEKYQTPTAEKIEFDYQNTVTASGPEVIDPDIEEPIVEETEPGAALQNKNNCGLNQNNKNRCS